MNAVKKKIVSEKKPQAKATVVKAPVVKAKPRSNVALLKMPRPSLVAQLGGKNDALPREMQALLDKNEIGQLVASFARALDRADETLLRSVLHPDATIDFGPGMFQGTGSDYVNWQLGVLSGVKSSHHHIGQTRTELEGDTALVESYVNIQFRLDKPVGREDVFMGCRYLDRMERRPSGSAGVWKVIHRKQIIDWVRTEAVSDIFYHQNPDALWNNRSKMDPSYQMAHFPGGPQGGKLPAFLGRRYERKSVKF